MPIERIALPPSGEEVKLLHVSQHPEDIASYFNALRSGYGVDVFKHIALAMLPFEGPKIARAVCGWPEPFQAMISPPSSRGDAKMLRDEISKVCSIPDLSAQFARKNRIRAADSGTLDDLVGEFIFKPSGVETSVNSLLIVDELVSTGKTVAAVIHHLRANGLPSECKIVVAAYGWIRQRRSPTNGTSEIQE